MTTKKFRLIEYSTDGSIFDENVFNTRKEATQVIANIMANDEHADPQLFKIQVEEVEVKTKTELLVEELVAKLKRYGDEWIVTQEDNRAYISRTCGLWSSAVLMDIVEFMQQPEYADHGFHINREGMLVIYNPEED